MSAARSLFFLSSREACSDSYFAESQRVVAEKKESQLRGLRLFLRFRDSRFGDSLS